MAFTAAVGVGAAECSRSTETGLAQVVLGKKGEKTFMQRMMVSMFLVMAALGCATAAQMLDKQEPQAVTIAEKRAQFEMACPTATGSVLSREMVQPVLRGGPLMAGGVERAEYTIGVAGCDKRETYVVICPQDSSGCFAADGRR